MKLRASILFLIIQCALSWCEESEVVSEDLDEKGNAKLENRCAHAGQNGSYSYGDDPTGPDNWPSMFQKCAGECQSPINIDMSDLSTLKVGPLKWGSAYFNTPEGMSALFDGHNLIVRACYPEECKPKLSGGCLNKPYVFEELHFHWGGCNSKGSEHTIDEFAYPLEMQVLHKTCGDTSSSSRLIVAYFFQVNEKGCDIIDKLLDTAIKAVKRPEQPVKVKHPFHLAGLVQPFSSEYITYNGSLTTPPCTEGVKWIVYPYPLDIAQKQMNRLRSIYKYAPNIINNYRPVQPLNDRKVYFVP